MLLLLIGALLLPFAFLDKAFSGFHKKIIILSFCLLFILLGGLRWNTGTDWNAYYNFFNESNTYLSATESLDNFEWGYSVLNFVVNYLTESYTAFLLIFTTLMVFSKYIIITNKNFLRYSLFSLFLYYCYYIGDIVSVRQLLASSIVFLSLLFIINKKPYKFLFMVILATLIHRTAIICLIIYNIYYLNISKLKLYFIFFSSMILGLFLFNFKIEQLNIPYLSEMLWFSSYQQKLDAYSELGQVVYGNLDTNQSIVLGYIRKILFIIPLIFLSKNNVTTRGLLNICVLGSAIYFVLGGVASDFRRFGTYFDMFELLLIPIIIYSVNNKKIRYLLILFYSLLAIIKLVGYVTNFWDLFHPFHTILDMNNFRYMY